MFDLINENCDRVIRSVDFSSLKNKRVLITGASGLIGIHMVSVLKMLREKYKYDIGIWCWVFSDIDPCFAEAFDGCVVLKSDLTDSKNIQTLRNTLAETLSGFDLIIHAAGYGQPQKFTSNKIKTIELNTHATINLFSLLNKEGSFLFCSTSEVYSGIDEEGIDESRIGTTLPDHPRACYIEGKRCGEAICQSFSEMGYNAKIARISLAYGPGTKSNDARVISNLIDKGLRNNKIELLDSGSSIRTYGYISDIVEMLFNIVLHGKQSVYNVSGVSRISILELAKKIGENMDCEVSVPSSEKMGLSGNPKVVNMSIDRYTNEFGNKKFETIDFGLEKTINWQVGLHTNVY
jgi:UDP-glucuronate decarboxylase